MRSKSGAVLLSIAITLGWISTSTDSDSTDAVAIPHGAAIGNAARVYDVDRLSSRGTSPRTRAGRPSSVRTDSDFGCE